MNNYIVKFKLAMYLILHWYFMQKTVIINFVIFLYTHNNEMN